MAKAPQPSALTTVTSELLIPLRTYDGDAQNPVIYGPYRIDKFTRDNADRVRIWFTWRPDWPPVYPLFSLELKWDDDAAGTGGVFSGVQQVKFGIPQTGVGMVAGIPHIAGQRRAVTRGDILMKVYATFQTNITIQALFDPEG